MGIPLNIFSLYRVDGEGRKGPRHVLLRVRQSGFRNADASEYDFAFLDAEEKRRVLLDAHLGESAARARLVGELQSYPAGDELNDGPGGGEMELWVAQTRYGAPWVVLGTAASEAAFWSAVDADDDLSNLGAVRPAKRVRVQFFAEEA
jgi:hypothetical protein